jgi:hypothetical protein
MHTCLCSIFPLVSVFVIFFCRVVPLITVYPVSVPISACAFCLYVSKFFLHNSSCCVSIHTLTSFFNICVHGVCVCVYIYIHIYIYIYYTCTQAPTNTSLHFLRAQDERFLSQVSRWLRQSLVASVTIPRLEIRIDISYIRGIFFNLHAELFGCSLNSRNVSFKESRCQESH